MARELCDEKSRNILSSAGFCYTDVSSRNPTIQSQLVNQIQRFQSTPEIFNLHTTDADMIGFSKNLPQQPSESTSAMWKGFYDKAVRNNPGGPSSSNKINESTIDFYQQEFNKSVFTTGISDAISENLIVGPDSTSWQENRLLVDDSSLRCVFPCEGNERPSQGLSLSLSSINPSGIGLQSFELRHTTNYQNYDIPQEEIRFMDSSSRDGFLGFMTRAPNLDHQGPLQLRNSKYLASAQDLLNEFCSHGSKQTDAPKKSQKPKQWNDENGSRKQCLQSLEFMELQKRKTKLLAMREEVDRRYKQYCDQMKAVVSSFEAVAGNGAATVYSALASKAMSRNFRRLRDGIVAQIHATKKALGEEDQVAMGTTRGETPRLRIIDQTLRQQRAFQQMNMMETHPWRPQRGLPERSVSVLRAWLFEHFLDPYPNDVDKHILSRQTGLSRSQVSNWFINARVRLWKPMVEEMYSEEFKEQENNMASTDGVTDTEDNNGGPYQTTSSTDQKPTTDHLIRIEPECLSSIVSDPDKRDINKRTKTFQNHHLHHQQQNLEAFGAVELDFSSYNHHTVGGGFSYTNDSANNQNFNGGGVSLTLGLQQHGGSGVNVAFPPASLFCPRDHIEDSQPVQYSLLDGEGQNVPYRNLIGAQLLHDLA